MVYDARATTARDMPRSGANAWRSSGVVTASPA